MSSTWLIGIGIVGNNRNEIEDVKTTTHRAKSLLVDCRTGSRFHADINGAVNIAVKHLGTDIILQLRHSRYCNVKLHNPVVFRNLESLRSPLNILFMGPRGVAREQYSWRRTSRNL